MRVTALPQPPGHLLSIEEYSALGEDEHGRYELQEGRLLVSPSPSMDHMIVIARLVVQLDGQLPRGLQVVPDVDVDLQLAPPDQPGWSRRPDLLIVADAAAERVRSEGGLARASEVLVAVEVVSPGSKRTDHVIKRGEYADAGIPRYWIVDLDDPFTLIDCQLAGGLGYQDAGATAGTFATEVTDASGAVRFPVRLDLDRLLRR